MNPFLCTNELCLYKFYIILGWPKSFSELSIRWYRKPQQTLWPTQYISIINMTFDFEIIFQCRESRSYKPGWEPEHCREDWPFLRRAGQRRGGGGGVGGKGGPPWGGKKGSASQPHVSSHFSLEPLQPRSQNRGLLTEGLTRYWPSANP